MAIENGWSYYFRVLKYFGILPISLSEQGHVVSTKVNRRVYHIMFAVIQTFIISLFVYGKVKYWSVPLVNYGSTGQHFELLEEVLSGVINIILHPWMFFSMEENLKLVKNLLECDMRTLHLADKGRNYTLRNFFIATSCVVFFNLHCLTFFNDQPDLFSAARIIIMLEYLVHFTYDVAIMSFYTSLVWKVRSILERINRRFEDISRQFKFVSGNGRELTINNEIMNLLKIRNQVLVLCSCDLSSIYGLVILFVSGLMLVHMTHVPYYIVYRVEQEAWSSWVNAIFSAQTSILYIIPKLVVFVMIFTCNNIGIEVSFYNF